MIIPPEVAGELAQEKQSQPREDCRFKRGVAEYRTCEEVLQPPGPGDPFAIPRTARGGAVVFDHYNGVCDLGSRLAIDRFCAPAGLRPQPLAGPSAWLRIQGGRPST